MDAAPSIRVQQFRSHCIEIMEREYESDQTAHLARDLDTLSKELPVIVESLKSHVPDEGEATSCLDVPEMVEAILQLKSEIRRLYSIRVGELKEIENAVKDVHREIYVDIRNIKEGIQGRPLSLDTFSAYKRLEKTIQLHMQLVHEYALPAAEDEDHIRRWERMRRELELFQKSHRRDKMKSPAAAVAERKKPVKTYEAYTEHILEMYGKIRPSEAFVKKEKYVFQLQKEPRELKTKLLRGYLTYIYQAEKELATIDQMLSPFVDLSHILEETSSDMCTKKMKRGREYFLTDARDQKTQKNWDNIRNSVLHFGIATNCIQTILLQFKVIQVMRFSCADELQNLKRKIEDELEIRKNPKSEKAEIFRPEILKKAICKEDEVDFVLGQVWDLSHVIGSQQHSIEERQHAYTQLLHLYDKNNSLIERSKKRQREEFSKFKEDAAILIRSLNNPLSGGEHQEKALQHFL